jgi:hypothetical protein
MAFIRIDLTEQLGAGQYVEIRDPRLLPWGTQKRLQQILKDESIESQLTLAENIAVELIRGGHVLDENHVPIAFPLNGNDMERVPAVVIETVVQKFAEIRKSGPGIEKK